MTKTKTFDGHSGKFLSAIANCMPDVPSETMQEWIENPGRMKTGLEERKKCVRKKGVSWNAKWFTLRMRTHAWLQISPRKEGEEKKKDLSSPPFSNPCWESPPSLFLLFHSSVADRPFGRWESELWKESVLCLWICFCYRGLVAIGISHIEHTSA